MKNHIPHMKKLILICTLLISSASSKGGLLQPAVTLEADGSGFDWNDYYPSRVGSGNLTYQLGDGRTMWFDMTPSGELKPLSWTVGGAFYWYSLEYGTQFDQNYVQRHASLWTNMDALSLGNSIQTELYKPFYLGYLRQTWAPPRGTYQSDDGYGWALLKRTDNKLELLDSALYDDTGGIIVGTTIPAPEPSTYALFGIGAIGILMVLRRKKTA